MNKLSHGVNLLPEQTKKAFTRHYYLTLVTTLSSALALATVLGVLLLIPSYLLARNEAESSERYLSALEETVGLRERAGVTDVMRELSEEVSILSSFESSRPTANIIKAIDQALPRRVFLQGVSVTHFGPRAGEVALVGIADTREDLLAFSDALKATPLFKNVSIPVNQLVPGVDVKFSFSFGFTEKEQ